MLPFARPFVLNLISRISRHTNFQASWHARYIRFATSQRVHQASRKSRNEPLETWSSIEVLLGKPSCSTTSFTVGLVPRKATETRPRDFYSSTRSRRFVTPRNSLYTLDRVVKVQVRICPSAIHTLRKIRCSIEQGAVKFVQRCHLLFITASTEFRK